jgi:hypothetical protein
MEQGTKLHIQAGLLDRLSTGRRFDGLALVHEAPGQRPARRRVCASNEHDALVQLDDDVDGGDGIAPAHGSLR